MFKSILGALLAHKQVVIAAIAIAGIGVYAFPYNALNQAQADHASIVNHFQDVEIPCPVQYCNPDNLPDTQETIVEHPLFENAPPIVHIRITFSFV